jgi:hypothetical protein
MEQHALVCAAERFLAKDINQTRPVIVEYGIERGKGAGHRE